MSGVGALIFDRGEIKGEKKGRVKALYYDANFTIEEIAEKTKMSEEEIKEILSQDDED